MPTLVTLMLIGSDNPLSDPPGCIPFYKCSSTPAPPVGWKGCKGLPRLQGREYRPHLLMEQDPGRTVGGAAQRGEAVSSVNEVPPGEGIRALKCPNGDASRVPGRVLRT